MNSLIVNINPIELIKSRTAAENSLNLERFINQITKLYQYEIFKAMLDLVATLCSRGKLSFKITDNGKGLPRDFDMAKSKSLGIRLVYNLIKQLSGNITCESRNGSSFIITFKIKDYKNE